MLYDLIIVGGGPAGVAAGIYAARKKLKTILITESFGGQSVASGEIQNFIGFKSISGFNLAKILKEHLQVQSGIKIIEGDLVVKINPSRLRLSSAECPALRTKKIFKIITKKGKIFKTRTILLTLGSRHKKLNISGEKEFAGRGIFYCAICDAPLMKNKTVAVIGGGNAGLEAVRDLLPYAAKIYILEFLDKLTADPVMVATIKKSKKIRIITSAAVQEIFGKEPRTRTLSSVRGKFVQGLKYQDRRSGKIKKINLQGIFISIGYQPNSEIVKNLVKLNKNGEVIIDPKTQETSQKGIWAAGDVTDGLYHQNNIAIADAIKAVLNIYQYLLK